MTKGVIVEFWMEVGKLGASIAMPIVIVILGILFLRRIESVKATVATQSEFHKKWAEQFFKCCQEFLQPLERVLALLIFLAASKTPYDDLAIERQNEVSRLLPIISELELRLRRSIVFAPLTGGAVTKAASECLSLTYALINSKKGNVDEIICKMNEFNIASRKAHAEMLGLKVAKSRVAAP